MNVSTGTLLESLRAVVGERVHEADARDAVAGFQPQVVVEMEDEEQVAALLAFANERRLAVLPRAGGTQRAIGAPPASGDIVLDVSRMSRVLEHVPHDLTVSVQAGAQLTDLQETLRHAGQWLALDPSLAPGATIGGLIATNVSGPRRLRYGGVRDQIIGVRVALADGTLAKGGGKVVKNVAGYDLPKLFTGSLGTLGVIVSATFRLYPVLPYSRTVIVEVARPDVLCNLAVQVIASTLVPSALDVHGQTGDDACTFAARFESGVEASVEEQSRRLTELASTIGAPRSLTGEDERRFWTSENALEDDTHHSVATVVTKTSVLAAHVGDWLDHLHEETASRSIKVAYRAHAGHGLIETRFSGDESGLAAAVAALREVAVAGRGSLVVTDAPPSFAALVDPWGPIPALDVMRRLKDRFDPNGILNPGRFVGGI